MMRALAIVAALAGVAHADRWDSWQDAQGGAWLHYELSAIGDVDDTVKPRDNPGGLVLAGARLHGFVGKGDVIGYHVGVDLAAGGTLRGGGFAYDVALFPLGIGVRVGATGVIALGAGVGAMGATATLDDAMTFPLEANAELGGGRLRVLARVRASYIAFAADRHDGAPSIPFADELDATLGLRIGHHYDDYGYPTGNGYWGGVAYRELAGSRYVGLVIGYSIDMATPRKGVRGR
ncbi:MAG TPA: hypothetical protein VLX92_33590 [Kofleriaceae bacterium]|nr:hypothetical protein [Kofleriaceae bacterium]